MALCGIRPGYLRFQAALGEVFRVECEDEVCASFLGADTVCIVLGVRRHFRRAVVLDGLSPLPNEVDERADRGGSNVQSLQNFLVLGENIFSVQPDKIFPFRPTVEKIGARNPACNVLVSETGDARHHNIRVHNGALFSLPRLRLQR